MEDWWNLENAENRDVNADDKFVMDTKWKHSKGFVKYKLMNSYPEHKEKDQSANPPVYAMK
jgi:hypothetical protein